MTGATPGYTADRLSHVSLPGPLTGQILPVAAGVDARNQN